MDDFGDTVIIIKDERKFIRRIVQTVQKVGGEYIPGDVRYHVPDSTRHDYWPQHTITLASSGEIGIVPMQRLIHMAKTVIKFGCLDKSIRYATQKEWRIRYLPQKNDTEPWRLEIGDLSDVASRNSVKSYCKFIHFTFLEYWIVKGRIHAERFITRNSKRKSSRFTETAGFCLILDEHRQSLMKYYWRLFS